MTGTTPRDIAAKGLVDDSLRVQVLRGLACVLLVSFHVIGRYADSGMVVADDSWWRAFANIVTPLRMPLFTFLSGFVYAYRPVLKGQTGLFFRKKIVRLWLPLLAVTTIYYLGTVVAPDASGQTPLNRVWTLYFFPYVHFWFLQAIIVIFSAAVLLEAVGALATVGRYSLVLAVAFALSLVPEADVPGLMSWPQALRLAPFFLLGLGANRFPDVVRARQTLTACAIVFAVAMAAYGYEAATYIGVMLPIPPLGIVVGATGALTLLRWLPVINPLARLGAFSYAIYLFHPFFVFPTRKLFGLLHLTTHETIFAGCLLAGLSGPVVLELVVRRVPIARAALLGQR